MRQFHCSRHGFSVSEPVPASSIEPPPPSPFRDNEEVTSSEWFHFDYLAEALGYAGPEAKSKPCILEPFSLPGQSSLSHHLLTSFVELHIDKGEAPFSSQLFFLFSSFSQRRRGSSCLVSLERP